jgi:hypothetical protein
VNGLLAFSGRFEATPTGAYNCRELVQQTAPYSITSSAVASNAAGILNPSPFAVLRLMTNSNFVGCLGTLAHLDIIVL